MPSYVGTSAALSTPPLVRNLTRPDSPLNAKTPGSAVSHETPSQKHQYQRIPSALITTQSAAGLTLAEQLARAAEHIYAAIPAPPPSADTPPLASEHEPGVASPQLSQSRQKRSDTIAASPSDPSPAGNNSLGGGAAPLTRNLSTPDFRDVMDHLEAHVRQPMSARASTSASVSSVSGVSRSEFSKNYGSSPPSTQQVPTTPTASAGPDSPSRVRIPQNNLGLKVCLNTCPHTFIHSNVSLSVRTRSRRWSALCKWPLLFIFCFAVRSLLFRSNMFSRDDKRTGMLLLKIQVPPGRTRAYLSICACLSNTLALLYYIRNEVRVQNAEAGLVHDGAGGARGAARGSAVPSHSPLWPVRARASRMA